MVGAKERPGVKEKGARSPLKQVVIADHRLTAHEEKKKEPRISIPVTEESGLRNARVWMRGRKGKQRTKEKHQLDEYSTL